MTGEAARFDTFVVVDWSAANDRGPTPRADAIWAAVARGPGRADTLFLRNRQVAEDWLTDLLTAERAGGRRVLAGFDFPFGYPAGFAESLTGNKDPLALWDWLASRLEDQPGSNNRFDLAAEINGLFHEAGPFWGNPLKRDIPGLDRTKPDPKAGRFPQRRATERAAPGSFPVWQLAGAGSVGSQALTGLPVLSRLRRRPGARVWPFEATDDADIVLAEVWPSLLRDAVTADNAEIRDEAQVRLLATALAGLANTQLARMFDIAAPEAAVEGWILGLGHEQRLAAGLQTPPPLRNDCFALPPGVDWTPVEVALDRLRGAVAPVTGIETCPVIEAGGRILAQGLAARRDNPPGANTAVDGWGFAHAALSGAPPYRLSVVAGRGAPGAPYAGTVPQGAALRMLTGALLPRGVDTVVLDEDCRVAGGQVSFAASVRPGANARPAGEDKARGDPILHDGRRLTPPDLALLSATGHCEVPVRRRLRVAVLSTGSELADPGAEPADPAVTYDANRPMLLSLVAAWGHDALDLGRAPDDRAALRAAMNRGASDADVILTSGGASAGDEDHVSALLGEAGTRATWRIALKPGRPLALGFWAAAPVFGLPGNPVAAFVCALIFARPALERLAGGEWTRPQAFTVPAAFAKSKKPGRVEYLRARLTDDGRAEAFASEGSGRVSGLSWATGLVELPHGGCEIGPGDPVRFLPYAAFGL